jgi:hypothetical protein
MAPSLVYAEGTAGSQKKVMRQIGKIDAHGLAPAHLGREIFFALPLEELHHRNPCCSTNRSIDRISDGVVFVGKAQEKCTVYRTEKRHNPRTGNAYVWIVKSIALVNHYYFY